MSPEAMPVAPRAWCAACGKEVPLDGHYSYEGRAYHLGCLRSLLRRRLAGMLRTKRPSPEQLDEMLELEEALKALEAE